MWMQSFTNIYTFKARWGSIRLASEGMCKRGMRLCEKLSLVCNTTRGMRLGAYVQYWRMVLKRTPPGIRLLGHYASSVLSTACAGLPS